MVFGQCQGDVGCIINGNSEAKLLAPELIKAELCAHKHSVRCIGHGQSAEKEININKVWGDFLFCNKACQLKYSITLLTFFLLVRAVRLQTGAAQRHPPETE